VTTTVIEPLDQNLFTFKLSNVLYSNSDVDITQSNVFKFSDSENDFESLNIRSLVDGDASKIVIGINTYDIADILPNGILILNGSPSVGTDITYTLYTYDDQEILTSDHGIITMDYRALVDLNDSELVNVNEFIKINDFVYYSGEEYRIVGFDGNNPCIEDYSDGDAAGVTIATRRRLLDNAIGYFNYSGLYLDTSPTNYEASLNIVNGVNATEVDGFADDNNFVENYMVQITISGVDYYYKIESWDGTQITLSGLDQNWETTGTAVDYLIVHLEKQAAESQGMAFDMIDRRGDDTVVREINIGDSTEIVALSLPQSGGTEEHISQEESVTWEITYRNGETKQGGT
jgi:hypothetical protein